MITGVIALILAQATSAPASQPADAGGRSSASAGTSIAVQATATARVLAPTIVHFADVAEIRRKRPQAVRLTQPPQGGTLVEFT